MAVRDEGCYIILERNSDERVSLIKKCLHMNMTKETEGSIDPTDLYESFTFIVNILDKSAYSNIPWKDTIHSAEPNIDFAVFWATFSAIVLEGLYTHSTLPCILVSKGYEVLRLKLPLLRRIQS